MRRPTRQLATLLGTLLVALSACGGGDEDGTATPAPEPAAASPAEFPPAQGKTLQQLTQGLQEGAILAPSSASSQRARVKDNRFAFAIVDRANKQIDVSQVAVYTARPDGSELRGPFAARKESLDVAPPYRSAQTASDLANGKMFYVARPQFDSAGSHIVFGLVRLDGRFVVADAVGPLKIGAAGGPPQVGERAIRIHTQTGADVGGDLTKLSTRMPPPEEMLGTDFADVVGSKPVVLLFATPALCESRTCGPVVDIAEQVRAENGKGVTFIQQEIYEENDPGKAFQRPVKSWRLLTEPWAFVIDRSGKVAARFEGVFSTGELARAVARVK
ncbi:MAG: hypothetical protein H0W96_10260 [Solirubrobacterales bacterium]|nr:hypothetical protein [Solirubrobacterales bacterium]